MTTILRNSKYYFSLLQISATDPDCGVNSQVRYGLADNSARRSLVSIDDVQGTLCLTSALDYETLPSFQIAVIARDGGICVIVVLFCDKHITFQSETTKTHL